MTANAVSPRLFRSEDELATRQMRSVTPGPRPSVTNAGRYRRFRQTVTHVVMGLGGEDEQDTAGRVAAYEATRKAVSKVPLRAATVTVTAWGIRVAREAERRASESAERARLTAADVIAEAKERIGDDVTPVIVHPVDDDEL